MYSIRTRALVTIARRVRRNQATWAIRDQKIAQGGHGRPVGLLGTRLRRIAVDAHGARRCHLGRGSRSSPAGRRPLGGTATLQLTRRHDSIRGGISQPARRHDGGRVLSTCTGSQPTASSARSEAKRGPGRSLPGVEHCVAPGPTDRVICGRRSPGYRPGRDSSHHRRDSPYGRTANPPGRDEDLWDRSRS